jgi:hypothetical protein
MIRPFSRVPPASRRDPKQGTLIGQGGQARRLPGAGKRTGPLSRHDAGWVFGGFQYPTPPLHVTDDAELRAVAEWKAFTAGWPAAAAQAGLCP